MIASVRALIVDESGVTSIEYVILAMLIAVVAIAAVTGIGTTLSGEFSQVSSMYK